VGRSSQPARLRLLYLSDGQVLDYTPDLDELLRSSLKRDSVKDAVAHAVEVSGRPRREVYARALELARQDHARDSDAED